MAAGDVYGGEQHRQFWLARERHISKPLAPQMDAVAVRSGRYANTPFFCQLSNFSVDTLAEY